MHPLNKGISVVLPLRNPGPGLEACLQSLFAEDIVKLIVVDGGDGAETAEILNAFNPAYRVMVIREADKGIYDAMNKGIAATDSEWLYFIGADDRLLPGTLSRLLTAATSADVMVYGDVRRMPSEQIYDGPFTLEKLFHKNICQQAVIYRRRLFDEIGLFKSNYRTLSDYAFNIQVFYRQYKTRYVPVVVAAFCETGSSANIYDEAFWADYKYNFISVFKGHYPGKQLYGRMWKYFSFTLYGRKHPLKALWLWLYISAHQRSPSESLAQIKALLKRLISGRH